MIKLYRKKKRLKKERKRMRKRKGVGEEIFHIDGF
jgi:hypothetical protein